ncbi:BglG family transcription antiterminator [Thermanaeromonas toyohensis]|nr:BglG family transcription antiterminator [Thermanaeromonas toyohensis]
MVLTARTQKLLNILMEAEKPLTISYLAHCLAVSPRTIRYDLDRLRYWVKERGMKLECRPRVGVWLEGKEIIGGEGKFLPLPELGTYVFSPDERWKAILALLLRSEKPVTAHKLASELQVSRTTILKDLETVEEWLRYRGLELVRKPKLGFQVLGEEMKWRQAVADLLAAAADENQLYSYLQELSPKSPSKQPRSFLEKICSLISKQEIKELEVIVQETINDLNYTVAEGNFYGLLLHLAVALQRIKQGKNVFISSEQLEQLRALDEFRVAYKLAERLERTYGVKIPEGEIGNITLHFMGAKMRQGSPVQTFAGVEPYLLEIVQEFVRHTGAVLGFNFFEDKELIIALALHFRVTFHKLRWGLSLRNPLLQEIKEKYPQIFFAARQAARRLEEKCQVGIPEDEIGYLAVHLAASIERQTSREIRYKALLVCGSGIGTAQLLLTILRKRLPELEIVGLGSVLELPELLKGSQVDYVITTVPLELKNFPVIQVNPLLQEEDILYLRRKLLESPHKGGPPLMLKDVLTEETISLDVEVKDWEEAVRAAGRLLVRKGVVEERYVESMVRTVKELGPYIVIAPGIAMPHARPEDGVKQVGLSLVRLRPPVDFGNKANDPVDIVIAIAGVDRSSHLQILAQLSKVLSDKDKLHVLRRARSAKEIIEEVKP